MFKYIFYDVILKPKMMTTDEWVSFNVEKIYTNDIVIFLMFSEYFSLVAKLVMFMNFNSKKKKTAKGETIVAINLFKDMWWQWVKNLSTRTFVFWHKTMWTNITEYNFNFISR